MAWNVDDDRCPFIIELIKLRVPRVRDIGYTVFLKIRPPKNYFVRASPNI